VSEPPLEEAVLDYVREHDFVTFAALHKHFAGDAREETEIALPGNRVIWAGLPKPLIDAVLALLDAGRLAAIPGNLAAYRRDGRVLELPVLEHVVRAGFVVASASGLVLHLEVLIRVGLHRPPPCGEVRCGHLGACGSPSPVVTHA
jgi:hypothetical protein